MVLHINAALRLVFTSYRVTVGVTVEVVTYNLVKIKN